MDSGVIQNGIFIYSFSAKDMNISTVQIGGKPKSGYANEYLQGLHNYMLHFLALSCLYIESLNFPLKFGMGLAM